MWVAVTVAAMALATGGCGSGGQLTGAGGAGPIMTGSGGSGLSGGTGTGAVSGMNCAANPTQLQPLPPDILIVLDTSASMNDAFDGPCAGGCGMRSKWADAVAAIDSVVGPPRPAVNWGLKLIADGGEACDAGGIAVPTGGQSSGQITTELARRTNAGLLGTPGNSPLRAAIEVAASHLSDRDPGPLRVILLVTDSVPDCKPGDPDPLASDAAGAVQAVGDAAATGIATYVVGVGTLDADTDAALDQVATAGGLARTGTPAYAPASKSTDLPTAMSALVTQTAACTFAVPEPPNSITDRGHIELQFMGGDGFYQTIPHDPVNGWDYTDASMRGVQLHGTACDPTANSPFVGIVFLCVDLG